MYNLELAWDRPAHTGNIAEEHVLRVRARAVGAVKALPLRMAIALDSSSSMEGEKLKSAKDACDTMLRHLRPEDKVWIASFATRVIPLVDGVEGDSGLRSAAQAKLADLEAEGVTRTDLALEWIQRTLKAETGLVRVGILITDGHPTDTKGSHLGM